MKATETSQPRLNRDLLPQLCYIAQLSSLLISSHTLQISMPNPTAFAATRPINPPGAEPVLTEQQVWKALQIKARKPQQFVPMYVNISVPCSPPS